MKNIKVSIGLDFLTAFSKIPKRQQKQVREFIEKFRNDPTSSGINYEKIHDVKDENVRTVRIGLSYRAVVIHPPQGNVYLLVWVDHHDEAILWAKNKKFDINKYTGAIQVVDYEAIDKFEKQESANEEQEKTLFAKVKEEQLLMCGVPEVVLPTIKKIKSEEELDSLSSYLPQEAAEALYMFACGYTYADVVSELALGEKKDPVDEDNFTAALANENSKRRFYIVEDAKELAEILTAPLEQWRVFLHPSQRRLVERSTRGSTKVLGGAGTGKTVVAMHRARHLAENIFTKKEDKILFTTFSRNLAADIKEHLLKICSYDTIGRIEVINIDAWVSDFLKKHGFTYEIIFGAEEYKYWQDAINLAPEDVDFDDTFFIDEWRQVIQLNGISNQMDYMTVSRVGRGRRISRQIRKKIWPVFEEYRNLLNENGKKEFVDLVREARMLLENKGDILPYKAIVVDEGQDMNAEVYRLLRQIVPTGPNDIFIVGDGHQSIFQQKVILGQCGINVRGHSSKKLKLNYRTTEEIRKWAVELLEGKTIEDLDGGEDNQKGYRSLMHGEKPIIKEFSSYDDEFACILKYIDNLIEEKVAPEGICIVTRTHDLMEKYKISMEEAGHRYYQISRNKSDCSAQKGIRLATMHRVKGLEFDYMIVASANKDTMPLIYPVAELDNPTVKEEAEMRERSLFYVATTRAKREVLITSYNGKSRYLLLMRV